MRHSYESQLTDTTQHAVGEVAGAGLDQNRRDELAFLFGRACFTHCVAIAREIHEGPISGHLYEYIAFLEGSGPRPDGTHDTNLYVHDRGWSHVAMADLLRLEGYDAAVQNLAVPREKLSMENNRAARRVTTLTEEQSMRLLTALNGEDRTMWAAALWAGRRLEAVPIVTIQIPLLSGKGMGGHTVVVTKVGEDVIQYLDPDAHAIGRYEGDAGTQQIQHVGGIEFSQSADRFAERMTGEVMWVSQQAA